jgi:hypothetical protein
MRRWLLPAGLLLALAGYFSPWIDHPVAGLVITGLDLGEYVKFLPDVRSAAISIWRQGFYAPLVAASTAALLAAYRADMAYPWWLRAPLLVLAAIAALNLVPPAWTPARLLETEFLLQTACLFVLLAGVATSPFLALLPRLLVVLLVTSLVAVAIVAPLHGFFRVLPVIEELYNRPLTAAWGLWAMVCGLLITAIAYWLLLPLRALQRKP